jgi:hypothetical protein
VRPARLSNIFSNFNRSDRSGGAAAVAEEGFLPNQRTGVNRKCVTLFFKFSIYWNNLYFVVKFFARMGGPGEGGDGSFFFVALGQRWRRKRFVRKVFEGTGSGKV